MIITRTPLRISFVGGGTDLPAFYLKEPGGVVSTSIDKYVYVLTHQFFSDHILLKYFNSELVSSVDEIKMTVIKEALKLFDINKKIEIVIVADLPKEGGSGLGGSSAFSVGLLNALSIYKNRIMTKIDLANESTRLEIEILKNPIGKQDQFASALGGLNFIQFNPDESVNVVPIFMNSEVKKILQTRLLLFYTGKTRMANNILKDQQYNMGNKKYFLLHKDMYKSACVLKDNLLKNDISNFGKILHENWLIKRELSSQITNSEIDDIYNLALKSGAEGGKLLGAGGGGFFLFYCKEENQDKLKTKLKDLREYNFNFDSNGTSVILIDNNSENNK
jgi:D-glycero-alpha-D-manno-heptose-7-phosphate kinase